MSDVLLERGGELAAGELARVDALAGRGSSLVLEGAAGIGKTRLLEAIVESALGADTVVLRARGGELERGFAYGVVRQLFEGLLTKETAKRRRLLLSGAAAIASAALEDEAQGDDGGGDVRESFAVVHGLYWLTANMAAECPLMIAVDDAHWADAPSLRFLVYLARRLEELPILLVMATRQNEPESERELIAQMITAGRARVLRPNPLSDVAIGELLTNELGVHAHERFVAACHRATAGNPFYVTELASALRAERVQPTAEAAETIRDVRPETLSRAVLTRLARLSSHAGALAQAVAVLGADAELRHAAELAGLDLDSASSAADDLANADLLAARRPLAFIHAIVRTAIYEDILPGERAARHAAAARLLAAEPLSTERVAEHLLFAEPVGDAWVVDALWHDARDALSRGAPAIAVQRLRRALSEPPDANRRARLLVELARAELGAGEMTATIEHCRQALDEESDARARAEIAVLLRTALVLAGRPREAVGVLEAVLEDASDLDLELVVTLETAIATAAGPDMETASVALKFARSMQGRVARDETKNPWAIGVTATSLAVTGERSAEYIGQLAERAADIWLRGDYEGDAHSPPVQAMLQPILQSLILAERFVVADVVLKRAQRSARERGWIPELRQALAYGASSAYRQGALALAEADARQATALSAEYGERLYAFHSHATLLLTLIELGALGEARTALDQFGVDPLQDTGMHATWLVHARGRLLCAERQPREGLRDLLEAGARFERQLTPCPTLAPWRSDAALTHLALGDGDSALRLADEELELARAYGAPRALGIALRAAGLINGEAEGIELLEEAVSILDPSAARLEHARALVDLGAALRRRGRRADARKPLERGRELAHAVGAAPLADRASQELRATGARPRALMFTGRDVLTASERRIAELAADGLATREIAQMLFVTARTVDNHLARIYQKLGIRSRKQLRTALEAAA